MARRKPPKSPLRSYSPHRRDRWKSRNKGLRPMEEARGPRVRRSRGIFTGTQRRETLRARRHQTLIAILILAAFGAAFWWWWNLPASVSVIASPADATIEFDGRSTEGTLTADELEPGEYAVSVSRKGFATITETITLERGRTTQFTYALLPLDLSLTVSSVPSEASYTIEDSLGQVIVGETPIQGTVSAGMVRITLATEGFNDYSTEIFVDEPRELLLWMDPEGQLVHCLNVFDSGPAPKGATFSPDGTTVWTTLLAGPPSVQVFDPMTGALINEIQLGEHGAVEVIFSEDGSTAWVSQMETARVYEIDVASMEVTRTFDTGSAWSKVVEVSPDGQKLYVANWSGHDVSVIDLATGTLDYRIRTANTPRGLYATPDGLSLYVAGFGDGTIAKIDLERKSSETVFGGGGAIRHLVADKERGVLFASDMAEDCVWALDLATDTVTKFASTDQKPNTIDLSPDGRILFVSCRGENNASSYYIPGPEWGSILLFDTASGMALDAIVGGNQPTPLNVSPDGTRLIFGDFLDDRLRYYEIPSYETLVAGDGGLFGPHHELMRK